MSINDLIARYRENAILTELMAYLNEDPKENIRFLRGVSGSLDAVLIAALQHHCQKLQLVVLENQEEALALYSDLSNMLPDNKVWFLPMLVQQGGLEEDRLIRNKRTAVIRAIGTHSPIVVASITALVEKVVDQSLLADMSFQLAVGQNLSLQVLEDKLQAEQFTQVDFVYKQGQFALRGGIIDIYSAAETLPYRIELWGNTISSMRIFNPKDQKSFQAISSGTILSHRAIVAPKRLVPFVTCLPVGSCIWIKDQRQCLEQYQKFIQDNALKETDHAYESIADWSASITLFHQIHFGLDAPMASVHTLSYNSEPQPFFRQNFNLLAEDFNKRCDYTLYIAAIARGQLARVEAILREKEPQPLFTPVLLGLRAGYIDHIAKIVCYTDHQFFNRYYKHLLPKHGVQMESLCPNEDKLFQVGDYIVHSDHGIGRFAGLHTLTLSGHKQEVMRLVYKNNDTIYVNVHELYKLSKYTSKDGTIPNMHKLGTVVWQNKKKSVKKVLKDIAKELITLYAKRKATVGFAFSKDRLLDTELASSFEYEETADQALAIAAVKADMERAIPMDRLICGDVGFGKTEIAIRAACKAAFQGKQVALLVPTTILALQHYNSFIQRLSGFPVEVSYINRFKTNQEIKQTLADTASGKIDILIGTHNLLSKGVQFKDLGLLIIDEEQKFGVHAKEKLKQLRSNIDSLTLTATPIPRTLHFSLMGARDLSILMTPPTNRRPIQTTLYHFDDTIIKKAIEAEIARNGQVLFIDNKVSNIAAMAHKLSTLSPAVRICIAHGQMTGSILEEKIGQFVAGKYDVLVATSIIESGMDIPNVNTIIINNSHILGLADLHQMRGRVGRSNVQAFCYLLIPEYAKLTPEAKLRLRALEEFSTLGDGFKLAMSDLNIRGAGDLLGAAQSGFIADIGLETYTKMVEEAVEEVKYTDFKTVFEHDGKQSGYSDSSIETDCEAFLPSEYVQNTAQRMALYARLHKITHIASLSLFTEELVDRFGPLPPAAEALLETMQLRWVVQRIGFQKLSLKNKTVYCYLGSDFQKNNPEIWDALIQYIQCNPMKYQLKKASNHLILKLTASIPSIKDARTYLTTVLKTLGIGL